MIEDLSKWEEVRPSDQVCIRATNLKYNVYSDDTETELLDTQPNFCYVFRQLTPNVKYCRAFTDMEAVIKDPILAPYLFVDARSNGSKKVTGLHVIKP